MTIGLVVLLSACGPSAGSDEGGADGTTTEATTQGTTATTTGGTTVGTTMGDDSTTTLDAEGMSSSEGTCSIGEDCAADVGGSACGADSDCPEGFKCAPSDGDADGYHETWVCVPLARDPAGPGESCTIEGWPTSGADDCDAGSLCLVVDVEALTGQCAAFCTYDRLPCEGPRECSSISLGMYVCLVPCDPLLQDCIAGEACYPFEPENGRFDCLPHLGGVYGDPCEVDAACGPGLYCTGADAVPGCRTEKCCTSYCDASAVNADAQCPGVEDGQVCGAWYCGGAPEPALEPFGICGNWDCD